MIPATPHNGATPRPPDTSASRRALAGFLASGLLLAFTGAILPAWGYHIRPHYVVLGNYFLAVTVGLWLGVRIAPPALRSKGTGWTLTLACIVAFAAFVALSLTAPPVNEHWRLPGLLALGFGGGLLNTAIVHAISASYRLNAATTVNMASLLFGGGAVLAPLLVAGTFHVYSVSAILFLIALVPGAFAIFYARTRFPRLPVAPEQPLRTVLTDFTVPAAVLFAALLFFHFGNEWAIASWLPLFLIQRLGLSPTTAMMVLALYWLALIVARLLVQLLLSRVSHPKLLVGSAAASLFGCLMLTSTNNLFGAVWGVLLVGFGFAPIYPVVVERIGASFPNYHPGLFNGIFSVAITGGLLAPATLGYAAEYFGVGVVMALPAIGTFIVLLLVLVIWLESKVRAWMQGRE